MHRPPNPHQGELSRATSALTRYFALLEKHDPAVCTESQDAHYLASFTGKTGAAAVASCQQTVRQSHLSVRLVGIEATRVVRRYVEIQFTYQIEQNRHLELVLMVNQRGRYLIDAVYPLRPRTKAH